MVVVASIARTRPALSTTGAAGPVGVAVEAGTGCARSVSVVMPVSVRMLSVAGPMSLSPGVCEESSNGAGNPSGTSTMPPGGVRTLSLSTGLVA